MLFLQFFLFFLPLFLFAVQILSSLFIVTFFFDVKTRETVVYYPQVNEQAEAFASACFSKIVDSFHANADYNIKPMS